MTIDLIFALIITTGVLVAIPGPNVALIVANTLHRGPRFGSSTVFGTTSGIAVQLAIVTAGLATVISLAATALVWIKWLGVLYLLYLAVRTWTENESAETLETHTPSSSDVRGVFWQGFAVALINPKTLLMNAAYLPQFVRADGAPIDLAAITAIYLAVLLAGDLVWVMFANQARRAFRRFDGIRNRLTASVYGAAGIGLALSRIEKH